MIERLRKDFVDGNRDKEEIKRKRKNCEAGKRRECRDIRKIEQKEGGGERLETNHISALRIYTYHTL